MSYMCLESKTEIFRLLWMLGSMALLLTFWVRVYFLDNLLMSCNSDINSRRNRIGAMNL